jgi:hypothetical protein
MTATFMLRTICAGLLSCTLLIACNRPAANAASVVQQYDIVTRTRPESQDGYLQTFRGMHQVCNATRALMKLPPGPPLVALPADFVTERTHYLGSGGKFLTRRETFFVDTVELTPEVGCKSRISSDVTEELVQDGQVQGSRRGSDGKLEVDPPEPLPPAKQDVAQPFTERKNMGGVALRCVPANANPLGAVMQDMCVPDSSSAIPLDGRGEAIIVHARAIVSGQAKMVSLTEPVSVQLGKPVNPASLKLSTGQ